MGEQVGVVGIWASTGSILSGSCHGRTEWSPEHHSLLGYVRTSALGAVFYLTNNLTATEVGGRARLFTGRTMEAKWIARML